MGENVLQGQVKSFKKGTDRSLKNMAAPTLFDRADIMSTVYTASPVEDPTVAEGDRLEAHVAADGSCIHLVKGHVTVGRIEGDGARALLQGQRVSNMLLQEDFRQKLGADPASDHLSPKAVFFRMLLEQGHGEASQPA